MCVFQACLDCICRGFLGTQSGFTYCPIETKRTNLYYVKVDVKNRMKHEENGGS